MVHLMPNLSPEDLELATRKVVIQAKQGSSEAFSELYEFYFDRIYKFIFFRVNHKEIAEDLAEDVFVKAWTRIKSVKEQSFGGWLYQITKNTVIDYYRQKKTTVDLQDVENILEYEHSIVDETNAQYEQKRLLDLIRKLTPDQQIVIKLKFLEELDNSEIAELISKSEGSIRVTQHRALQRLNELLIEQEQLLPSCKFPRSLPNNPEE